MASISVLALVATLLVPSLPRGQYPSTDASDDYQYDVTLTVDPGQRTVSGRARLRGARSPLQFHFSDRYAFKCLEPRLTDGLSIASEGTELEVEREDPFTWKVVPSIGDDKGLAIDLAWTVKIDHREHPDVIAAKDRYEQPCLTDEFSMLFTGAVLPFPEIDEGNGPEPRVKITFEAPEGWDVITPWPAAVGTDRSFAPSYAAFRDDVVLLGNWRVRQVQAGALAATFAFAPGEEWLEPLVEKKLRRIIEAEIELFGGAPQPKYLFAFGPSDGVTGYGGSPSTSSMTLFISQALPKASLEQDVSHLVAHEFHHTWMRARCRPRSELRFVIEGFTDYYAYLVSWRLGNLSDDAFQAALEAKVGEGARALETFGRSLAEAGGREFFQGRAAYDACYASGLAIALWTDLALRAADKPRTLDEFMRAFYGNEAWDDGTNPTLGHWGAQLTEWLGADLAERQVAAVRSEDGFDLLEFFEAIDVPIKTSSRLAGTTPRANFKGAMLRVLDPAGPAALAGLRARDLLTSVNGVEVTDESSVRQAWSSPVEGRLVLAFLRDGEERTIDVPVPTILDYALPASVLETLAEDHGQDD